jgi:YebC/PmpR family DNA-binding regulatory protein
MSGHSKWAQIKRQKGANDAKRGQMFTKLAREITVAARQGGGDPETNFRLRLATQRARSMNMPQENITRAIARATGGQDGAAQLEEVTYEGYGPGGVAIFVEALTDNRNRTVAEVRNVLTRNGGSLGENGSVAWIFEPRGVVLVNLDTNDADEVTLQAIDAGATDVNLVDKTLEIYTNLEDLESVRRTMESAGLEVETAERTFVPKTMVTLDDQKSTQVVRLIERLEDLDDVQNVSTNLDLSEELVAQLAS